MHGTRIPLAKPDSRAITIRLARDPNDLMLVTAIRAAVYLAEQDCPFDEEFDGNDMVAAHFSVTSATSLRVACGYASSGISPRWSGSRCVINIGARASRSSWSRRASTM